MQITVPDPLSEVGETSIGSVKSFWAAMMLMTMKRASLGV